MTKKLNAKFFKNTYLTTFLLLFLNSLSQAGTLITPNVSINTSPKSAQSQIGQKTKAPNKQSEKQEQSSSGEKKDIYLNFENATLASVVDYLAEQKNINIVPREELKAINVSLATRNPLTLNRAWDILLTLLEINGFTIINVNGLYRITPKANNQQEPLPMYSSATGTRPIDLPDSDLVVRYIYFLKNIKVETAQNILSVLLEGNIQINKDLEACIITEKSLNIKSAMKVIEELDQGGLRESIKIIPLKHADAQDVAKLFQSIAPRDEQKTIRFIGPSAQKPASHFSSETKIIPEIRRNSLILLGTETNLEKIINFIYKYIDVPIKATESRLHIKEIKHAKAETLKPIIEGIIKPPAGTDKNLQAGEFRFFEDVIIAADSSKTEEGSRGGGNRLIIACNKEDWKRLSSFIDQLDKPQPQVAFEVVIVDVSIKTNRDLFAQFKLKGQSINSDSVVDVPGIKGPGVSAILQTAKEPIIMPPSSTPNRDAIQIMASGIGTNFTFGPTDNLWGMIKAVLDKENYNIITQPYIVANNYQKCVVDTTETRQVEGKFRSSSSPTTEPIRQQIPKNATTKVSLTPKVNLNGTVDLDIEVEISSFQETDETDPNTNNRTLITRVCLQTGEVLVLGGLTKSKLTERHYKVPVLSNIPILGNLFKSKTKAKEKTNLYIFIRPSIIKPRFEGVPDEYTQLKLDYAKYQTLKLDTYAKDKDPIQRWFFKPSKENLKQKIADAKKGIFRPIDNYAYGHKQPKSIDIKHDPYFRSKETIAATEKKQQTKKEYETLEQTPAEFEQELIKNQENISLVQSQNPEHKIIPKKINRHQRKLKRRKRA